MRDPSATFTWQLRASATNPGKVAIFVRKHQFQAGAPVQFDLEDDRISALEYALGGLVADVVGGLHALARRRRVAVDEIEAVLSAELDNPLTYLGVVDEAGHPGLSRVRIEVYVRSREEEPRVRQMWDEVLERSPLVRTCRTAVDLLLRLRVTL